MKIHKKSVKAMVKVLVEKFNLKDKTLLDIGCGAGYHASCFDKQGVRVIACDFNEDLINQAKKEYGNTDIRWIHNDVNLLGFDKEIDVIFSSGFSLFNTSDLNQAHTVTTNLFNYLVKDGLLIFLVPSNLKEKKSGNFYNHSLEGVINHFDKYGEIIGKQIFNIQSFFLLRRLAFTRMNAFFSKLFLKIHRRNVWIMVIVKKGGNVE